jgi:hypothetical protein
MNSEQAWACGFTYGMELQTDMPFDASTPEAGQWCLGWVQGALRKIGLPHYGNPVEQAFNNALPLSPESASWQEMLESRLKACKALNGDAAGAATAC